MTSATERLSENVAKIGVQLDLFKVTLEKLDEILNGTAKTGGLKERIAIAEDDIKRNKDSFLAINKNINELRTEMLIEVGKIAAVSNQKDKAKGDFGRELWQSSLKAIVGALAVGVTGIIFWQLIIWLAAHAPVK
jgi:hypothetical protein